MSTEVKLDQFHGPLDLLLQLIDQEKLDITELALSKITEQYLAYLEKLDENRSEELADFLVIATRLVYLKSQHLLPSAHSDDEEGGPGLAEQLKLYKQYLEASKKINIFWQAGRVAYGREEPPVKMEGFILPNNARAVELRSAIESLLRRLKPIAALPQVSLDRSISLKQKIEFIYDALARLKKLSFNEVLEKSANRTEAIVSFLAVLELIKQGKASFHQANAFDDMIIQKI